VVNFIGASTQDYAILQLSQDITPLQLQVVDAMGRMVINQVIVTVNGYYVINTSSFAGGMYYVTLYGGSGKLFGDKLSIFMK